MIYPRIRWGFAGVAMLMALPCLGAASTYTLRRDDVISVVFEQPLTLRESRPGDLFRVRVTDTGQLPRGSELEGRIDRVHPAHGKRPASMDLRFTQILLPDKSRVVLDAAPLALDDRYVTRSGDGRISAKKDVRKQRNDIFGGAIGGFIVGSLFHRRVAGTVIGTVVGASAAEADRERDSNLVVAKGERVGALINRNVNIDYRETLSRYDINRNLDRQMADPIRRGRG